MHREMSDDTKPGISVDAVPPYSFAAVSAVEEHGAASLPAGTSETSLFAKFSLGSKHHKGVRLLCLLPGSFGSALHCSMEVASLYSVPEYEALSYTWEEDPGIVPVGESHTGKDIDQSLRPTPSRSPVLQLSNEEFPIQQNLWWALQHLRHPSEERKLWIDAVCIDQMNTKERNHQVGQMGEIYQLAKEVIVWVGREDKHSAAVFKLLEDPTRSFLKGFSSLDLTGNRDNLNFDVYHASFNSFCERTYWKRLWIVQEIGLASKIWIHCGTHSARWEAFTRAGLLFREDRRIPMKIAQQRIRRREGSCSLESLLEDCGQSLCQDPKDKVYGLLGLVTEGRSLEVDYSKSLFDVFADVAQQYNEPDNRQKVADTVRFVQHLHRMWPELYEFDSSVRRSPKLLDLYDLRGIIRGRITRFCKAEKSRSKSNTWHKRVFRKFVQESAVETFRRMMDALAQAPQEDLDRILLMESEKPVSAAALAVFFKKSLEQVAQVTQGRVPRIFLEESGQFGLGPSTIQEGDLLCQFPNCDIAAIVRLPLGFVVERRPLDWRANQAAGGGFKIIGRAVVAKRNNEMKMNTQSGFSSTNPFNYSVPEISNENDNGVIAMKVTLKDLYLLTR